MLDPLGKKVEFEGLYSKQFEGMTIRPIALKTLLETREQLAFEIHSRLDDDLKAFLLSVQGGKPDWDLLAVQGAAELPAVKWRMHNLGRMKPEAMRRELERLEKVLTA